MHLAHDAHRKGWKAARKDDLGCLRSPRLGREGEMQQYHTIIDVYYELYYSDKYPDNGRNDNYTPMKVGSKRNVVGVRVLQAIA